MYRFLKGWKHHYLVRAFKGAAIQHFEIQKNEVILTYIDGDFFAGISPKICCEPSFSQKIVAFEKVKFLI